MPPLVQCAATQPVYTMPEENLPPIPVQEQQLLEHMQDPANQAEVEQYTLESVNAAFGI